MPKVTIATRPLSSVRQVLRDKWVEDPVHGEFALQAEIWEFVDTPHFQRLRYIKQLGVSSYVKLGATHTRFEHSLGVAHLARRMVEHLQEAQPELHINSRDIFCVTLAGLCHDLGHGPFSHVWDSVFMKQVRQNPSWTHEKGSEIMFDDLVKKNEKARISKPDAALVKALIAGNADVCRNHSPPEKTFLFDIVANNRNGIDVDKMDYISRDRRAIGQSLNISLDRLIRSARVIEDQICYNITDANRIYELCSARYSMYKEVYTHETTKALEHMVSDALYLAEPILKLSTLVDDPEEYIFLTDDILQRLLRSTDPRLHPSRQLIKRIQCRDLYTSIGHRFFQTDGDYIAQSQISPKAIVNACRDIFGKTTADLPTEDDVLVDRVHLHFGMKDDNPLSFVKFYSMKGDGCCRNIEPGEIPTLAPRTFRELLVRVFARHEKHADFIAAGFSAVLGTAAPELSGETSPILQESVQVSPTAQTAENIGGHYPSPQSSVKTTSSRVSVRRNLPDIRKLFRWSKHNT